ncbi:unnamed protein product [Brassicogethes aeneus]|uniref:RNA helicase n=1 Tax=Brassicogethes aeneus TaxID=1431903 RepID=A0A9P0FM86_BRAAE|nr:unnamed protein product [Brassicogethes aeneus]
MDEEYPQGRCMICNYSRVQEDVDHESTYDHKFNFRLWEWKHYKKALVKNRHGICLEIKHLGCGQSPCTYEENVNKGLCAITVHPNQYENHRHQLIFDCLIKNSSKNEIYITDIYLVHPTNLFQICEGIVSTGGYIKLETGAQYKFQVKYAKNPLNIGSIQNPVCINFQSNADPNANKQKSHEDQFTIARNLYVKITEYTEEAISTERSPFSNEDWETNSEEIKVVPPTQRLKYVNKYPIPDDYVLPLKFGLRLASGLNHQLIHTIQQLRNLMQPNHVTLHNYRMYFHILLWLEEMGEILMLKRYNMSNVLLTVKSDILELEVPGLAEKRPSLIAGDMIDIRLHGDHTCYRGVIKKINDKTIEIGYIHEHLINYVKSDPKTEMDVRFVLGRLNLERQHEGIDRTFLSGMVPYLFPTNNICRPNTIRHLPDADYINQTILTNQEQKKAVSSILYNSSGNVPYIVFGPPGTGKTVTIVEAILQLKRKTDKKILVCAPANAACNMIASKLMVHCNRSELIRVHSETQDMQSIDRYLRDYSNIEAGIFIKTSAGKLNTYRIVITTLVLVGRYVNDYKPDVVFVDEAAQASEPECSIAIGFLKNSKKQLILAGDPKQLGPNCCSNVAERYGYGKSLLERLMEFDIYQPQNPNYPYYITMLKLNFRCHPLILEIPNKLFYEGHLIASSTAALNDPVGQYFVFNKNLKKKKTIGGRAIEFFSVISKEKREGRSPSYFNPAEVEIVMKYVHGLLTSRFDVQQSDIGIVTPYIRQVHKIKYKLKDANYEEIEVGTTETFQGREKRIIIISCVRAQDSLLKFDREYNLGFVRNSKRFNVALTRAMSKLIVIGCPSVLCNDSKWLEYIELSEENEAYFGAPFIRRTTEVKEQISRRIGNIQLIDSQFRHQQNIS